MSWLNFCLKLTDFLRDLYDLCQSIAQSNSSVYRMHLLITFSCATVNWVPVQFTSQLIVVCSGANLREVHQWKLLGNIRQLNKLMTDWYDTTVMKVLLKLIMPRSIRTKSLECMVRKHRVMSSDKARRG